MIVKTQTVSNEQLAGSSMRSSPCFEANNVQDCESERHSIGLANIHVRIMASLAFAVLPGLTQLPSLATGAVPVVPAVPIIQPATTPVASPSTMNSEAFLDRKRSMDAARLTLEDYSGKRGKIPDSLKKQIDMQDRRLAICQDMSRDEWEWEQCFYYGTNNGGGAMYFDRGMFAENTAATKTKSNASAKPKVPTW